MNFHQLAAIVLLLGVVLLPQVVALYLSEPRESEPEHDYDYR